MEARHLANWVEQLRMSRNSKERRAVLAKLESLLDELKRIESEILFPVLQKFLGFREWMQEARSHHSDLRELIRHAHAAEDQRKTLVIAEELSFRVNHYLEGMEKILFPRMVQALNRRELLALRRRLGSYWMFAELDDADPSEGSA